MKIFLTGSTGFIGRHIASSLRADSSIELLSPNSNELNLLDAVAVEKFVQSYQPEILIHTAWFTSHGAFWDAPENYEWYKASCYLFDLFYKYGGDRVLSLGTCAEYCWKEPTYLFHENDKLDPATKYGFYKAKCMKKLEALSNSYNASFSWARIFYLFGAGENSRKLVPSIINSQLSQNTIACGMSSTTRDFSDVRSVGSLLAKIATNRQIGPINVASGIGTSIKQIECIVREVTGGNSLIGYATQPNNQPLRIVADVSMLKSVLGKNSIQDPSLGIQKYTKEISGIS